MALISDGEGFLHLPDEDNGLFVRIQSWDESKRHEVIRAIEGKRLRVTIEVIE